MWKPQLSVVKQIAQGYLAGWVIFPTSHHPLVWGSAVNFNGVFLFKLMK